MNAHFSEFENRNNDLLEEIIHQLKRLNERDTHMADDIAAANASLDKLDADVANIQGLVKAGKDEVAALQAQITELQNQIASGFGIPTASVTALTARADAIDAKFDAIAPDPVPAPAPAISSDPATGTV